MERGKEGEGQKRRNEEGELATILPPSRHSYRSSALCIQSPFTPLKGSAQSPPNPPWEGGGITSLTFACYLVLGAGGLELLTPQ